MKGSVVTIGTVVLALALVTVGPAAGVGAPTPTPTADEEAAPFGASVSSFMQASTAEANGSVSTGMWVAEFARSNASKATMVDRRTAALEGEYEDIAADRADLLNGSDENASVADRAKAVRLLVRAETLVDAINQTETAAVEAGVNRSRLQTLRQEAGTLSGGEVAELAQGLAGPPERPPPVANATGNDAATGPNGPDGANGDEDNNASDGTNKSQNRSNGSQDGTNGSQSNQSDQDPGGDTGDGGSDGDDASGQPGAGESDAR